jgi:GNAT superfamily N-acetyltransferase
MISTDRSLLSISALQAAFASDELYWAAELEETTMQTLIDNSLCFGLYKVEVSLNTKRILTQIGFSRFVTDYTTFAYMVDVYVLPEYKGQGLGAWMVRCCAKVVDEIPTLRRTMLLTRDSDGRVMESFYEKNMGLQRFENVRGGLLAMNKNGGGYVRI